MTISQQRTRSGLHSQPLTTLWFGCTHTRNLTPKTLRFSIGVGLGLDEGIGNSIDIGICLDLGIGNSICLDLGIGNSICLDLGIGNSICIGIGNSICLDNNNNYNNIIY